VPSLRTIGSATSSTEAEFIAAVSAAKTAKYLRSVLSDLGFPQPGPTILYEDNQKMRTSRLPDRVTSTYSTSRFRNGVLKVTSSWCIFRTRSTLPTKVPRCSAGLCTLGMRFVPWATTLRSNLVARRATPFTCSYISRIKTTCGTALQSKVSLLVHTGVPTFPLRTCLLLLFFPLRPRRLAEWKDALLLRQLL
jgi:hypothetical protein